MTNSPEMRALDPAAWEAAMMAFNGSGARLGEFFGLSAGIRAYLNALSTPHAQGDVTGLVAEIRHNVAIYTIEDEYDRVYLTAFGERFGSWHIDSAVGIALLKLCTLLHLDDGEFAELRRSLPHSDGAVAEPPNIGRPFHWKNGINFTVEQRSDGLAVVISQCPGPGVPVDRVLRNELVIPMAEWLGIVGYTAASPINPVPAGVGDARLRELSKLLLKCEPLSDIDAFDIGVALEELQDLRSLRQAPDAEQGARE